MDLIGPSSRDIGVYPGTRTLTSDSATSHSIHTLACTTAAPPHRWPTTHAYISASKHSSTQSSHRQRSLLMSPTTARSLPASAYNSCSLSPRGACANPPTSIPTARNPHSRRSLLPPLQHVVVLVRRAERELPHPLVARPLLSTLDRRPCM